MLKWHEPHNKFVCRFRWYLLLLSLINKDVALDSLKWDLSILLRVFKFKLIFPFKYVWSAKSGAILLITASQISCSLYPFFNPLLIWNIKLEQVSLSFYPGVPILLFILYSLNLIKVCNFSSFFNFSWKCSKLPVYKITNRGLVGIDCQWPPLSTNNLPIDYQCTIMFFLKNLPIIIGPIGKNKYFILHWQNIGQTVAIGAMHW